MIFHDATIPILFLLVAINGAPIIARVLLDKRFTYPIDLHMIAWDGRRILGSSKTVRGLLSAAIVGACLSPIVGIGVVHGFFVGVAAMVGDMFSSFIKRRLDLQPSDSAPFLDQIPEALFPLLILGPLLGLSWSEIVITVLSFVLLEMILSPVLYRMNIRRRPNQ